jgi:hypothetical protein
MSYRMLGGLDAAASGAAADQCHSAFGNGVRRGKCTAAVTTSSDLSSCVTTCDSSFDTKVRKDRCAAVCTSVWAQVGGGGGLVASVTNVVPLPVLIGGAALAAWFLFFRRKAA